MSWRLRRSVVPTKLIVLATALLCTALLILYLSEERDVFALMRRDVKTVQEAISQCLAFQAVQGDRLLRTDGGGEPTGKCKSGFLKTAAAEHDLGTGGRRSNYGRCTPCAEGTFSLQYAQWTSCKAFLTCSEIEKDVRSTEVWRTFGEWDYMRAEWNGYMVLLSRRLSATKSSENDWKKTNGAGVAQHLETNYGALVELSPSNNVLQPLGHCQDTNTIVFSSYEPLLGPLQELDMILQKQDCDNWLIRFYISMSFVNLLIHLHSKSYVMCSSSSLGELLSHLQINTDLEVILANFDNLLRFAPDGITCSQRELRDEFVAPEQRWPFNQVKVFNIKEQPRYGSKTDIWKIPDITEWIMGSGSSSKDTKEVLQYLTFVHKKCKLDKAEDRPTALEVLSEYELVWTLMVKGDFSQYSE